MLLETLLPLGKVDPGLRAPEVPFDLDSIGENARLLEDIGYDGLVVEETKDDPFIVMALAAQATSKLKLGTSVAIAFPRSPTVTAMSAWTLQKLSGGRFTLGLGTQVKAHIERRFGLPSSPAGPWIREYVGAVRAVWDCWQNGTKLDFKGQFYRFDLMTPFFNPGPIKHPKIPVYIAGVNEYMCRIAGEVCEGLHVHPFNSPKYLREFVHPAVEDGLRKSGRKRSDFTYTTAVFVVIGDTEKELAETRQTVKQQIAFYASTRTYEPVLAAHGWQDLAPQLHRKSVQGDWKGMGDLVTDEMVDTYAVTGSYTNIAQRIKERYTGLLDGVGLYQPWQPGLTDPRWPALVKAFNG